MFSGKFPWQAALKGHQNGKDGLNDRILFQNCSELCIISSEEQL